MIIRVKFYDNDFGSYFENFFDWFKFNNYYCCLNDITDNAKWPDEKIEMEDLFKKVFYDADKLNSSEMRKFAKYVKDSLIIYLKNRVEKQSYEYIKSMIDVKLMKTYKDEWENGETIYYFISKDKYILQ